jgi:hypothetical protein
MIVAVETLFVVGKRAKIFDGEKVLAEGVIEPYEHGHIYGAKLIEEALCVRIKDKGIVAIQIPYHFEIDEKKYRS